MNTAAQLFYFSGGYSFSRWREKSGNSSPPNAHKIYLGKSGNRLILPPSPKLSRRSCTRHRWRSRAVHTPPACPPASHDRALGAGRSSPGRGASGRLP